MNHPNAMTHWESIACSRGHGVHHDAQIAHVHVGGATPYHDYPPVPARFDREFSMFVYRWREYGGDGGYCPAHDAVSETIDTLGVWEPAETTLTLAACEAAERGSMMVDFGAQLGWFSLLAASCGLDVVAFDADAENLRLLSMSTGANGWADRVDPVELRVGPTTHTLVVDRRIAFAKIDLEGAERDAVRMLWPNIKAGLVDHLLIEISPVFADYYPQLVADLVDVGYEAWKMPTKRTPPLLYERFPADLEPERLNHLRPAVLAARVAGWVQENVWFTRPGASWA